MTSFESEPKPLNPEKGPELFKKMREAINHNPDEPVVSVDGVDIYQGIEAPDESEALPETAPDARPHDTGPLKAGGWQAAWQRDQQEKNDKLYGDGQDVVAQMKKAERLADEERKRNSTSSN
ncbi:MAG TPA: hypothetical protein VL335_02815 [Candidatus Paceibacterota bacterium]|jgi:hypothetical protein|nr:hypothetical protein [Candidatus Paceibacterota bacterium]